MGLPGLWRDVSAVARGILDESVTETMFEQEHFVTWYLKTGQEVSRKWSGSLLVARSVLGYTPYPDGSLSFSSPAKWTQGHSGAQGHDLTVPLICLPHMELQRVHNGPQGTKVQEQKI